MKKITNAYEEADKQPQLKEYNIQVIKRKIDERLVQTEKHLDDFDTENSRKKLDELKTCLEEFDNAMPSSKTAYRVTLGRLSDGYTMDLGHFQTCSHGKCLISDIY